LRSPPARARLQVLVVDPSTAAQQQLVRALARMGLEVHCVSGVAAASKRIAERYTDLVITESGLSDGDGFDLIRRLRAQPAYRFTPVLLLRSRLHLMDATRARLAGEVTVLAKPLTRQALESVVRQALRKSVILDELSELLAPH
jgi:two-component system chemotaxis response regulator CheY